MQKTRQISVRFSEDLYLKFENDARKSKQTLTEFVRKKMENSINTDAENERTFAMEKRIEFINNQLQKNAEILQRIDQAIVLFLQSIRGVKNHE